METRGFSYFEEANQSLVRIKTSNPQQTSTYQTFSKLSNGNLDKLVESGIVVTAEGKDKFIATSVLNSQDQTETEYDPLNGYYKRVFQTDEEGNRLRLIQYQD